jgi:hypothetical protein
MGQAKSKASETISPTLPVGLYPRCLWPQKLVKRLVMEKKLAPLYKGVEEQTSPELEECPICFYVGASFSRLSKPS